MLRHNSLITYDTRPRGKRQTGGRADLERSFLGFQPSLAGLRVLLQRTRHFVPGYIHSPLRGFRSDLFPTPYSLLPVPTPYSLLPIPYSLFPIPCLCSLLHFFTFSLLLHSLIRLFTFHSSLFTAFRDPNHGERKFPHFRGLNETHKSTWPFFILQNCPCTDTFCTGSKAV